MRSQLGQVDLIFSALIELLRLMKHVTCPILQTQEHQDEVWYCVQEQESWYILRTRWMPKIYIMKRGWDEASKNLFGLFIVFLSKYFQHGRKKNLLELLNGLQVQVIILAGHSALVGEHLSEWQVRVGVIGSTSRHQIVIDMSCLVTQVLIKPLTIMLFHNKDDATKTWTWIRGNTSHHWFWSHRDMGLLLLLLIFWIPLPSHGPEFSEEAPPSRWLGWICQSFCAQS